MKFKNINFVIIFIEWHGIVFVRNGIYKDGKFKFYIEFPKEFPKSRPNLVFVSKIIHPYIDQFGNVDMKVLFIVQF